jgi:hypothetical protein
MNKTEQRRWAEIKDYLGGVFDIEIEELDPGVTLRGHSTLTRRNEPEFYADAPWRVEPDLDDIPLLVIVRDANVEKPAKGPWHLQELRVEHRLDGGPWRPVKDQTYGPAQLPGVGGDGSIEQGYWTFRTRIPLADLPGVDVARRDQAVDLRLVLAGRFPPYDTPQPETVYRSLQVLVAKHALPLGRAAANGGGREWFYGDTHYHSAYTNDVWEFGNPVGDARSAGQAIGLDWLAITDHSCDLDDRDDGPGSPTRWERLKEELRTLPAATPPFQVILGEEVTLSNARKGYVHMLALGALDALIQGGFWSEDDEVVTTIAAEVNELLSLSGGYPPDVVARLFGRVQSLDQVLRLLPKGALAFAAHPYDIAQPPPFKSKWVEKELADQRLAGHEFWNGRARRQTGLTDNPFEDLGWKDPSRLRSRDEARLRKLRRRVEKNWEGALQRAAKAWPDGAKRPGPWPVFIAGSDAHGSFNYSVGVGWDYTMYGLMSDNALGRVRTLVRLPDHGAAGFPGQAELLAALRQGCCLVTDGPVLDLTLGHDGTTAHMGGVLPVDGAGEVTVKIVAHTTPEFGPVPQVELFTCWAGRVTKQALPADGKSRTVALGSGDERGYCRAQAWTRGRDGERFCCFTNPIWIKGAGGGAKTLRVVVEQRMAV